MLISACASHPPLPTTNSPHVFRALAVFPDLQLFVSASHDFTLRVWDAVRMHTVSQLLGHTAIVFSVAVLSSPGLVASGQCAAGGTRFHFLERGEERKDGCESIFHSNTLELNLREQEPNMERKRRILAPA